MLPEPHTVDEGGCEMKVIVFIWEACGIRSRRESTKATHGSDLHRKIVAEPTEVNSTNSTEEMANYQPRREEVDVDI